MIKINVYHFENKEKKSEDTDDLKFYWKYKNKITRGFILNLWEIHEIMLALNYAGYDKELTEMFNETWKEIYEELKQLKRIN